MPSGVGTGQLCGRSMSEAEFIESWQLAASNGIAVYALFLTILSAYLITAYMVGKDLTRSQVWTITSLFLVICIVLTFTIWGYFDESNQFARAYVEAGYATVRTAPDRGLFVTWLSILLNAVLVSAGLKFMWDIRKKAP